MAHTAWARETPLFLGSAAWSKSLEEWEHHWTEIASESENNGDNDNKDKTTTYLTGSLKVLDEIIGVTSVRIMLDMW